jgi:peptidyl-tRNA hydrolase
MKLITIINNKPSAKVIYLTPEQIENIKPEVVGLPGTPEELQKRVIEDIQKYHQNIGSNACLVLSPGNTAVIEQVWNAAKQHPDVKRYLETGELKEVVIEAKASVSVDVASMGGTSTGEMPASISSQAAPEALDLIANENNLEVLEAWRKDEQKSKQRKGIFDAITVRMKYLKDNVRKTEEGK